MDGQQAIRNDIAALETRLSTTEKAVDSFEKRLTHLEEHVKTSAAAGLIASVRKMEETVKLQRAKLIDIEDRSRRSDLIIFGIADILNETVLLLRDQVIDKLFSEKMGMNCTSVARIHRLGKSSGGKLRPIIVYFQDYAEKTQSCRMHEN